MFWISYATFDWAVTREWRRRKKNIRNWINKGNSQAITLQRVNFHKCITYLAMDGMSGVCLYFQKSTLVYKFRPKLQQKKIVFIVEKIILIRFLNHFNTLQQSNNILFLLLLLRRHRRRLFASFYLLSFWYSSVISILHALWKIFIIHMNAHDAWIISKWNKTLLWVFLSFCVCVSLTPCVEQFIEMKWTNYWRVKRE